MILSTDSTANLPQEYYEKLGIKMIPMQIYFNGEIFDDLSPDLPVKEFYKKMSEGAAPKTAQINRITATEYFENLLSGGEDVLHISFSTALSGNTDTIIQVANELNKKHSNKVIVINSLNASMGEGLLVLHAHDLMQEGKSINEIADDLNEYKKHCCSYFTVEQLKYLVRGGRLGKFSGIIGSVLQIKPILHVDDEGRLVSFKKVISRKKSIIELANICAEKLTDKKRVFITHADCEDEANEVARLIKTKTDAEPVVTPLTQVIGCHTGPGLIAVFFEGAQK